MLFPAKNLKMLQLAESCCRGCILIAGGETMNPTCQIIEVASVADAEGYACTRAAQSECTDCGVELCDRHAVTCDVCARVFCPFCLADHIAEQFRPVGTVKERQRKTA